MPKDRGQWLTWYTHACWTSVRAKGSYLEKKGELRAPPPLCVYVWRDTTIKKAAKRKKGNVSVNAVKRCRECRRKTPLLLNYALHGSQWIVSLPGHFTPGNEPLYPQNRRLDALQRRSGRFGEDTNLLPIPGIEPWTLSVRSRVKNILRATYVCARRLDV
jgi:hypothetical protein